MRVTAALLFAAGILLAVRVMFFGVRSARGSQFVHRAGPLSLGALLAATGALLYAHVALGVAVTLAAATWVLLAGGLAALAGWWIVRASAAAAAESNDPDEDPRYMYQGFVAKVLSPIRADAGGKVSFVVDGRRIDLEARWLPGTASDPASGGVNADVVIEHVADNVAWVESWALVESRL